ncbi:MAG: hypothetical protein AMXMBFR84_00150 [Candidatus Hydrogenedentota bacterium]
MNTLRTAICIALLGAVAMSSLVGCNTIRGAGRDIEQGGEAIQDAATEAQH